MTKNKFIAGALAIMLMLVTFAAFTPAALAADAALGLGSSGNAVTALQNRLISLGYCDFSSASGYFGALTRMAVIRFQCINGLNGDGIVGSSTSSLLYSSSAKSLVINTGAYGEAVAALQSRLAALGYFNASATGYYGSVTKAAVVDFQRACGIAADGIAGPVTRVRLFSSGAPYKQAASSQSKIADIALAQLGKAYVYATQGPDTFDCSGLAYYSMINAGYRVDRLSAAGYSALSYWTKITDASSLQKGDLLFFKSDTSSYISHMGIYIGGGEFVHASSGQGVVMTSSLSNTYWARNFVFARRVS